MMEENMDFINKDQYIYFLYSEQQKNERDKIEASISNTFVPGVVVVNGQRFDFTEISKVNKNRYPDCKLVAEGWRSKMKFTDIGSKPSWVL